MLTSWISENKFKSIDYIDFKAHVHGYITTNYDGEEAAEIEELLRWEEWVE
jgi:hypothetical protein